MNDPLLFWAKVSALGQVAGAFATFLAAAVALWISLSDRAFKLRVTAKLGSIHSIAGTTMTVTVEVENIGFRTARISGLFWSTGFFRGLIPLPGIIKSKSAFQIEDYAWVVNERFPWVIEPGQSKSTFFRREDFFAEMRKKSENDLFRKFPWSRRFTLFRHRVGVGVNTRKRVYLGSVDTNLTSELESRYEQNQ